MKYTRAGMIARFVIVSLFVIAIGGSHATTGAAQAPDQHPMLDQLANKVIQKYQSSSCQQLRAAETGAAITREGESGPVPENRSDAARIFHQQDCGTGREQAV